MSCDFTDSSFDLKIHDLNGKSYRLRKDHLDKKIVPADSKVIVKKNRLTIKMLKVKGEYGYDSWLDLTQKNPNKPKDKDADPGSEIMDMMKQMYNDGDDTMRKTLGEAMLKSRQKEMMGKSGLDDDDDPSLPPLPTLPKMGM